MFGELIAILAVLTFVGSNAIFRKTDHEASPTFINFFRTGIGTLTFVLIILILNKINLLFLLPWELWIILILSFVFGQVIGDTAYFIAQKEIGTTLALAISMTFPLFTFILSLIFLNQPFKLNLVISLVFIGIGVIIIGKSKNNLENGTQENQTTIQHSIKIRFQEIFNKGFIKAILFCFTAAIGWAIGAVLIELATVQIDQIIQIEELSSIVGNVIRFPFALLILGLMVWRENYFKNKKNNSIISEKSIRVWAFLIIASIVGTSIGAYLYTESVHIAGANVVALIASASPLFALPITYFINKEKITRLGLVGVVLTVFGVIIVLF